MAKSKKHSKKRNKSYPPLSKLDKAIYFVTQLISTVLVLGAIYGIFDIQTYLFLKSENVLAFYSYGSVWANIPYGIIVIIIFGIILGKSTSGKPLFGNKNHDYYNTTKYKFVLPVFDKRYTNRTLTKENVTKAIITFSILTALLIASSVLSFSSLCKRYELTEDMIYKLNAKGETVETYSYKEIENFTSTITLERLSSKSIGNWHAGFRITLPDGESISATTFLGLRDIESLYKITKQIPENIKHTESHNFNRYISQFKNKTEAEKKMLYEIYEQ